MSGASDPAAALAVVGTEILSGEVLDTNSHHLARTLTGLGARVVETRVLPDDPDALDAGLSGLLDLAPRLLVSTGGLGPTVDDGTLAAWARVLDRPLEEDAAALSAVESAYAAFAARGWVEDAALTPERRKMALLPRGSRPLPNTVGAAPGVVMEAGGTTVVALPGVPEEMRALLDLGLRPVLRGLFGASVYREDLVLVACGDESAVAPATAEVAAAFPSVRVKSRARRFGPGVRVRVTLAARGDDEQVLRLLLEDAGDAVARACRARGLAVETTGG